MFTRLTFALGFLVLLAQLAPFKVGACSGYPYFSMDDLPEMDLLVRATVVDADDRGYSAVIRVEDYYKGEGPRLLTVMRYNPGLETGRGVRGYDTGCLYTGQGHEFIPGSIGYFGLSRSPFETYTDYHSGSAHFYVWDGQITYQEGATEGYALEWDAPNTISEADLVVKLLQAGGRDAPVSPTIDGVQRYPLMRYLNIKTENGTRYQVNPDRTVSAVAAETVLYVSPDDAHMVVRADDKTLAFYYVWPYGYTPEVIERLTQLPGREAVFSHDSHMVAVWDESQLSVYMYRNRGRGNQGDWGAGMQMDLIASTSLKSANGELAVVLWSADSSTIAWQDASGIWRWNLYEDAEPALIAGVDATDGGELLDLSASGRYTRYGSGEGWWLFDSRAQETFVNALASPGDRHLIFVNTENPPVRNWEETDECAPPLRENCAVFVNTYHSDSIYVFPYTMELLGLVSCDLEHCQVDGISWHPAIDSGNSGYSGGRYLGDRISGLRQIAYDPTYSQPAVLRHDYQIEFDFYHSGYFDGSFDGVNLDFFDHLNLEGIVDSPIASIEWGQPIFYDTFMLTATEYLPRTVTIAGGATAPPSNSNDA